LGIRRAHLLLGESTARGPVTALAGPPRLTRSTRFTGEANPPLLMAAATDRAPLSTADPRRTAYRAPGPGARVRTVSEDVLSGAERTARHLRWATFFGGLGGPGRRRRVRGLLVTAQQLREDRILEEAAVTSADPQHLCAVFHITPETGLCCTRFFHPDPTDSDDVSGCTMEMS
jgi:hypothetical protein